MIEDTSKKFSPTKLECYKTCPKQYFYKYIERIPSKTQSVEAHVGKAVHAALEDLYEGLRNSKTLPLIDVLAIYEKAWDAGLKEGPVKIRDERFNLDDYRKIGLECITSFYKSNEPFKDGKVVGVEMRMGFALKDANAELGTDETYRIEGFLDRLMIAPDGAFEIHDYKTSKSLPTQADRDEDWQLAIYDIAVRDAWPDAKTVRLKWHYLRHGKTIVSTRTQQQLSELRGSILTLIRTIKGDGAFAPFKSALCDWCDYRDICPLFKHTEIVADLPIEARPYESGVKLVDDYAALETKKKQLKTEIVAIEGEQDKLKDKIVDYSKINGMQGLEGTSNRLEVHERSNWRLPTKTHAPKDLAAIESSLKATPVWDEVSKLDGPALMEGYEKKSWPRDILAMIENWIGKSIHRENSATLRLHKKKESDED